MAGGTAVSSSSGHLHPTPCIIGTIEWDTVVACVVRGRGISSMSLDGMPAEENFASKKRSVIPVCGVETHYHVVSLPNSS